MRIDESALRNAARYLGVRGDGLDGDIRALLLQAYSELEGVCTPRHTLRRITASLMPDGLSLGGLAPVSSRDLQRLFEGAKEGFALVASLGAETDRQVARLMVARPAMGTAFGACASAYVEEYVSEALCAQSTALQAEGKMLSPRFSPGYGDAPLAFQRPLLSMLEAWRIGVTLTEGLLMLPEKSVSAVMAIRPIGVCGQKDAGACERCVVQNCPYREESL